MSTDQPKIIKRVRCVTRSCSWLVVSDISSAARDTHGKWQFQCPSCAFWNLVSSTDAVMATSRAAFDLHQLPHSLRQSGRVERSEPGGINAFGIVG